MQQQDWDRFGNPINKQSDVDRLADEHWAYIGPLVEYVYKTAFYHGAKHQKEISKAEK